MAGGIVLVGTFLPWVYSGERAIDLYEIRRVAHRLEADVDLRLVDPVVLVPLGLACALVARLAGRRALGAILALVVAVYAGGGALLMIRSPLPTGAGVVVTGVGAIALAGVVAIECLGGYLRSVSTATSPSPDVATPHDAHGSARHR